MTDRNKTEPTESDKGAEENVENESETVRGTSGDTCRDTSQHGQASRTTRTQVARRRSRYTNEEIERGLHHVAVCSGNVSRAARELAVDGLKIPEDTLRGWVRKHHVERYRAIEAKVVPEIRARMAEQNEALALRHAEVEARSLERLEEELPNLAARDLSTTTRNLAVSKGIAVDKARELRGIAAPPTVVDTVKEAAELMQELDRLGIQVRPKEVPNLEGKATEAKDPEG